jgi:hypothetical protein
MAKKEKENIYLVPMRFVWEGTVEISAVNADVAGDKAAEIDNWLSDNMDGLVDWDVVGNPRLQR